MANSPDVEQLLQSTPIPEYARKLQQEWRSLLMQDSAELHSRQPSDTSFLYRPNAAMIDPDTLDAPLLRKAGQSVGDFHLQRLLGQGSMGQVWESVQVSLQRSVALKLIRPDRVTPELLRYFRREGRAGARLQHRNIVAVHAMGQTDGVHWIAQEFVEGECTLADFLSDVENLNQLPPEYDRRIALFFYQLADALHFAHEAGVIHRDLKPQNILITQEDRPKITDFGLARILDEGSLSSMGNVQGTPRYMSPEQTMGLSEHVDNRSDVFALGAMLYRSLCLHQAFPGGTLPEVLAAVNTIDPVLPSKHRPELKPELEAIILKALEKRPSDRYQSAMALAQDLGAFLDGEAPIAKPLGRFGRAGRWIRRNRTAAMAVAVVCVLALSVLGLSGALSSARQRRALASWHAHVSEARRHLERGSHQQALREFEIADALRPDSPETPLLIAGVLMRSNCYNDAQRMLDTAEERGYRPDQARVNHANDQYLRGIYLMTHNRGDYLQASQAVEEALRLDPNLHEAWYPLYQMRAAVGDHGGALEAIQEFRKGLTIGDPQARYAAALAKEHSGQAPEALADLAKLLIDAPEETTDWSPYMALRAQGRIALLVGDYELAQSALQNAILLIPDDSDSHVNLSWTYLARAVHPDTDPSRQAEFFDRATAAATVALGLEWSERQPLRVLALVDYYQGEYQGSSAIDRLREMDPDDDVLVQLDQGEWIAKALELWDNGQFPEAVAACESALDTGRNSWVARSLIAQDLFFVGGEKAQREGLEHSNLAAADWDLASPGKSMNTFRLKGIYRDQPHLVQNMLVFRFYFAALLDEESIAQEAQQQIEDYLIEHPFETEAELLNYAESLVMSPNSKLRDVERTKELMQQFLVQFDFTEGDWPAELAPTIENILRAIGKG